MSEQPACFSCGSGAFTITAIERPVVICQCDVCHNLFLWPGPWRTGIYQPVAEDPNPSRVGKSGRAD